MGSEVLLEDKKEFIKWLLNNKQMKTEESVWILNYLLYDEEALDIVEFVDSAHPDARWITMSTTDSNKEAFTFQRDGICDSDAEHALHSFDSICDEKIYITIEFPRKYDCPEYIFAVEVCDFKNRMEDDEISEEVNGMIDKVIALANKEYLMEQIDKALDEGDEELFMQLSEMLNEQREG